jgi:GWxTD domain-containing protein
MIIGQEASMHFRKMVVWAFIVFLLAACGIQFSPSKDSWYALHYYIMQDFERSTYKSLSPAAKLEFQQLFWEVRAPVAKQEFDHRIDYITKNFKKENFKQPWNTDRARVYLLNGNPAEIDSRQNEDWSIRNLGAQSSGQVVGGEDRSSEDVQGLLAEIWSYPFGQVMIQYVFTFSRPNSWKMNTTSFERNRYLGQFELQNKLETYAIVDEKLYKEKLEALKAIKEDKR